MQLSFLPAPDRPLRPARTEGERAARRCAEKAADVAKFDSAGARRYILGHMARWGDQTGEQLTDALAQSGFTWTDARCTGPLYHGMVRAKLLRIVRSDMPRAKGHGCTGGKLYALVGAGEGV